MSLKKDIALLERYNAWVRGEEVEQPFPIEMIHAIDRVTQTARRYEALRILNVHQFSELYKRNLRGENFDGMIDKLVDERERES